MVMDGAVNGRNSDLLIKKFNKAAYGFLGFSGVVW